MRTGLIDLPFEVLEETNELFAGAEWAAVGRFAHFIIVEHDDFIDVEDTRGTSDLTGEVRSQFVGLSIA